MSTSDLRASTTTTFEAWIKEAQRRRIEIAALLMSSILGVAWVVGRIVLWGKPANRPGVWMIPVQFGIAMLAYATMRHLPLSKRQPMFVGSFFFAAMAAAVAFHLSAMGGFDGPFFYAVYFIPPMTTVLPCALFPRIVLTAFPTLVFVLTYVIAHPEYLPYPMIHIPLLSIASNSVLSIMLGHATYKLVKERFDLAQELVRRTREETIESERLALARVLHDDLAQLTTAARMEIRTLERHSVQRPPNEPPKLSQLESILDALDRSARLIVTSLREPREDHALPTRLERLCAVIEQSARIRIERTFDPIAVPPSEQEVVYRVVQEALTNALKHAEASRVTVRLVEDAGALLIDIADNGRGFENGTPPLGWGLLGMRERVEAVNGELRISSSPEGTTICARLPLGGTDA